MGNCKSCIKPKTLDDDPGPSTSSHQHGNRIESGNDISVNGGRPPSGKQRPSSGRSNRDKSTGSSRSSGTTRDNNKPGVSAVVQGSTDVRLEGGRLPSAKHRPSSTKSNRVKSAGSRHTNDGAAPIDGSSNSGIDWPHNSSVENTATVPKDQCETFKL